ncbi:MAG: pyridoxal phosphate-dependent aminotransferase [Planctomycetes bacterium]|jgi:aspartate aminotransferase|nr:pyridoxal phosphate-dependent aminotransferase [Planctomycetota bacterium]
MQFAQRLDVVGESVTLAVTAHAAQLRRQGIDVVSFGAGEPDFDTPAPIKQIAIDALLAGKTKYEPTAGTPEARQAIADKLAQFNKLAYSPEQVIVSVGGKHSLYLAMMAVLNTGDEVILPAPYWVSYPAMVKLAGGVPVVVRGRPEKNFKITPDQLAAAITPRTRMFIINSPSNPGGHTYHPHELAALAEVIASHADIWVCSDEIYERLIFGEQKTCSWAALDFARWKDRTITCNCLSKTYAMTGWRIGYTAGPRPLIDAMNKLQSQMTSNITSFCMPAIVEALGNSALELEVEKMRSAFEKRGEYMWQRLNAIPGFSCVRPTGAFYAFAGIGGALGRPLGKAKTPVRDAAEFCRRVLDEVHVALVPGNDFGFCDHVRLSFATSMENINKGLDRLEGFLRL